MKLSPRASHRFIALSVAGIAVVAAGCGSSNGGSTSGAAQTVVIGATLPMTGGGAVYGTSMSHGLQAAVNVLNEQKVVPGVTFKVKVTDDQAEPGLAASQMVQLVNVNHADAIVSAFTTPPLAQLRSAAQYHVAVLNGGGNDPSLLSHQWLFNDILSSTQEEKAALQWAKSHLGVKRLGLLVEGDYTTTGIAAMGTVGRQLFPGNSLAETVDVTTSDPTPYINRILAFHPDAIYVGLPGALLNQTLKDLGSMGVKVPLITASQAFALNDLNTLQVTPQLLISRQTYIPSPQFTSAVEKAYPGFQPDIYTGTYYSLAFMIAKAVQIAKSHGSITGNAIEQALSSLPAVQGCCEKATFSSQHGTTSTVQLIQFGSGGSQKVVWSGPAPSV